MNEKKRQEFFARLKKANPNPTTELNYRSPFELLVAVILSAQATDKIVNQVTASLFRVANTPQAMVTMGEDAVRDHIRRLGLFNSKAKNLVSTCEVLLREHNGEIPQDRDALQALPGVGRKTANVILNTAFGQPTIAVDTHIFRVANRTRLACGKTVKQVEEGLLKMVPDEFKKHAHHWLILHGRYVCTARKPQCSACVISDLCEFPEKSLP